MISVLKNTYIENPLAQKKTFPMKSVAKVRNMKDPDLDPNVHQDLHKKRDQNSANQIQGPIIQALVAKKALMKKGILFSQNTDLIKVKFKN